MELGRSPRALAIVCVQWGLSPMHASLKVKVAVLAEVLCQPTIGQNL